MGTLSLESILQRDRTVVGGALAGIVLLSWTFILAGAGTGVSAVDMSGLPTAMSAPMAAMQPMPRTESYALLIFVMWWLMMLATMLPSAAPMILLFAALTRKRHEAGAPYTGTSLFSSGYLAVWGGFSALAVVLQWQLDRIALLSPVMATTSMMLGALLLIGAGVWQFTPLKHACLRHCRSPAEFLTRHWRKGQAGAFRIGEYIQSGNYRGEVESFSLRSVRLRHQNGPLYTVPFGVLGAVQNMRRDWVVTKLNIGVTYDTDIDKARKIVKKVGQELTADPELAASIMEPLKMQGVQEFGDFAVQLRLKMKTRPGDIQFIARRRALSLIKKAFDANGINFAYPTVQVAGASANATDEAVTATVAQKGLELVKPATSG